MTLKFDKVSEIEGTHVLLRPLVLEDALLAEEAVKDGDLWQLNYTFVPKPEEMLEDFKTKLQKASEGKIIPYAVMTKDKSKFLGVSCYFDIDAKNFRLEIGGTWYRLSAQRTSVNTECKFLLLQQAFEIFGAKAVEFRTHFLNQKSRKAIERLGAKLDGILRQHRFMPNGTMRDTCVYSILDYEWPAIKDYLLLKLNSNT